MAAGDELEKFNCVCRALILRANGRGIELHCDRCNRRWLVPFAELRNRSRSVGTGGHAELIRSVRECARHKDWTLTEKRPER